MQNRIPKIIHYCWFGKGGKSELIKKCLKSWEKYCPDYEIIEWNEENFDIDCIPFVSQAYQERKWAFVTDYARLKIIYENGGIYFDTDVELLRNIDELLSLDGFMGTEDSGYIATGLGFAAKKEHPFIKVLMDDYLLLRFPRNSSNIDDIACPILTTAMFEKHGYIRNNTIQTIEGITVFPEEYFCPINCQTYEMNITSNTFSIHHYSASWKPLYKKTMRVVIKRMTNILGRENMLQLKRKIKKLERKND